MRWKAGRYPQPENNTLSKAQTMRKQQRGRSGPRAPRPEEENPRIPSRPMPVYTAKKRPLLDPLLTSHPPVKKSDLSSVGHSVFPITRPEVSTFSSSGRNRGQAVALTDTPKPALNHYGQDSLIFDKLAHHRENDVSLSAPQDATKILGLSQVLQPQAGAKCPALISQPCPPPATRRLGQVFNLNIRAPGKRSAQRPSQTCQHPQKKPRHSPLQTPQKSTGRSELRPVNNDQSPPRAAGLQAKVSPESTKKKAAQVPSAGLQPPQRRAPLNPLQACTESRLLSPSSAPGQPLRMTFRRLDNGQWISSLLPSAFCLPPEKPGPPALRPHFLEKCEDKCVCVPLNVLFENFRIASSEDSESE
ncbi:putative protein FAM90A5P [Lemur catta]|uniref:putative protein FAM90A5P n=1 Tax=Lemur catta TaxID=9447 RepID=UPI001E26AD26|nr:putative protein FAM90A5P [Lemur catta]